MNPNDTTEERKMDVDAGKVKSVSEQSSSSSMEIKERCTGAGDTKLVYHSKDNEETVKPSKDNEETVKPSKDKEETVKPSKDKEETVKPSKDNEETEKPSKDNEEKFPLSKLRKTWMELVASVVLVGRQAMSKKETPEDRMKMIQTKYAEALTCKSNLDKMLDDIEDIITGREEEMRLLHSLMRTTPCVGMKRKNPIDTSRLLQDSEIK